MQFGQRSSPKRSKAPAPLRGIRVLDFGQYIAAPLAAMLLADAGAEVTHIDPPDGPRWATPANRRWNHGKACIVHDLRAASERAAVRRLVENADVLIENFRPGVMDRLGLGPAECAAANPRLVYCSLPGFAEDDPRADVAAWEGVIAAATGTYRISTDTGRPAFTPLPIASHFGAFQAAVSMVMALIARERDGLGQRIQMPLFDAMFAAIGAHGLQIDGVPAGNRPDDFWTGLFRCADGRWVQVSGSTPRFRERLATALGLEDWLAEGLFDIDRLALTPSLRAELRTRQAGLFASRPSQAWEDLGGRVDVPITLCRSTAEWVATRHARASGIVVEADAPDLGRLVQVGRAIRLSEAIDEREQVSNPEARPRPPATDPPLAGRHVLDLSQVLAGPTVGRTLAEFGADVIKVNNPREEGAGFHFSVHRYHTDVNRGKRSLLVDLKQPDGQAILNDLIDWSDVLIHNFRPAAAARLGLGYAAVHRRRPQIVQVTISAFGAPGPWTGWPGYEVQAQAATGLRDGGDTRPVGQPFAVNDYGTGLLGTFAAALGIFHRLRTGRGLQAEAALAYTATLLQSASLHAPTAEGDGLGWSPLQRLYQASDGWVFVGARPEQLSNLSGADGLEAMLHSAPADTCVERLRRLGIGAHRLVSIPELMRDPWVVHHGLSITRRHDTGEEITTVGPAPRLSRTPVRPGRPAASPGLDAADVLREIGRQPRLTELLARGVVAIEAPSSAGPAGS
jgi:crotonobetainyl-CoA:carnitine CoA-transferase CaiB-like acyl-CoA transferase